jgi:hypothetical protein
MSQLDQQASVHSITTAVIKHVIPLNNSLPVDVLKIWVNAEEIHARLIFAGVHSSLSLQMVEAALRHHNRAERFLVKKEYAKINYYRSATSDINDPDNTGPYDQRFRHKAKMERNININPSRDYFKQTDNLHFINMNLALEQLEQKEFDEWKKELEDRKIKREQMSREVDLIFGKYPCVIDLFWDLNSPTVHSFSKIQINRYLNHRYNGMVLILTAPMETASWQFRISKTLYDSLLTIQQSADINWFWSSGTIHKEQC